MPKDDRRFDRRRDRRRDEMPSTIARSDELAQRTWREAHDNAVKAYGEGERAHRTAYAALKLTHEKYGDHWVPRQRGGPSGRLAAEPAAGTSSGTGRTFGGIDYRGHSKKEFEIRAKRLGIKGYSRMNKEELAEAIARKEHEAEKAA